MQFEFENSELERLYRDPGYFGRWPDEVISKFRQRVGLIDDAQDERDFRELKSLHFEKLKGSRAHQHSLRLNAQWRLILELRRSDAGKLVVIISIEDYH